MQQIGFFGWSAVETRAPTSSAVSTVVRKRGSNAAVRHSSVCHATSRYSALEVRGSHACRFGHSPKYCTPSIPCRVAVYRPCPASRTKEEALLDLGGIHATRLSQGCLQMRASAPRLRRHHTTVEVLCASNGGPGYLGELPLVRSTSMLLAVKRESS